MDKQVLGEGVLELNVRLEFTNQPLGLVGKLQAREKQLLTRQLQPNITPRILFRFGLDQERQHIPDTGYCPQNPPVAGSGWFSRIGRCPAQKWFVTTIHARKHPKPVAEITFVVQIEFVALSAPVEFALSDDSVLVVRYVQFAVVDRVARLHVPPHKQVVVAHFFGVHILHFGGCHIGLIAVTDHAYHAIEQVVEQVAVENPVYNTASLSLYGMSGISYLRPYNFDAHTSGEHSILIRRNMSYGNSSQARCYTKAGAALTDGNGIICDITENYTGKTLVENNIVYNNGAGGIHLVGATNVDVINNTAYNNGQFLAYAEMDASYGSKNIRFISNIMSAKTGGKCIDNSYTDNNNITLQNANVVYVKNVMHNGNITPRLTAGFTNTDFTTANPQFKNTTPGTAFDFRLDPTKTPVSSAANFGSGKTGEFASKDFLGTPRQTAGANGQMPDCGAYESF